MNLKNDAKKQINLKALALNWINGISIRFIGDWKTKIKYFKDNNI